MKISYLKSINIYKTSNGRSIAIPFWKVRQNLRSSLNKRMVDIIMLFMKLLVLSKNIIGFQIECLIYNLNLFVCVFV